VYVLDLAVVGHLSRDLLITQGFRKELLGGGTAYASLGVALGADTGIVSVVGADFEDEYRQALSRMGLNTQGLHTRGECSTRFINEYDELGVRSQRVEAIAPSIEPSDLLDTHLQARVIHFCPLTQDEILPECFRTTRFTGSFVSLDAQGFLRGLDGDKVVPSWWSTRNEILQLVDVVKFDDAELKSAVDHTDEAAAAKFLLRRGPEIVIVTHERSGARIYSSEEHATIPLVIADRVVDTTGCGDTFVIGFLLEYQRTGDIQRAGLFGATCASFNLEHEGPYQMPVREMIEQRMKPYL
jgi:sugar/nucleoside kinase (ribokinase family)